jgi:YHS domain-containing protein
MGSSTARISRISRRMIIVGAPLTAIFAALASAGCSKGEGDAGAKPATSSTATTPLAPSQPVDPAFTGCAKSCGSRSAKDRAEARAQPGAVPGDAVFCPVSGAVFRINDTTQNRESRGKTLYFCCEACALWFTAHESDVLAKRGLA